MTNPKPAKRPIRKLNGSGKWLMTALSFTVFVGGWNFIARQERFAQANTADPVNPIPIAQPQPITWQAPISASWPTIEPLAELAPIPTLVPLSSERLNTALPKVATTDVAAGEQAAITAITLPIVAPLLTLEPLPAAPANPAPVVAPASNGGSATDFSLYGPAGNYTAGPTAFEWDWPSPLPPGYGFEVMVWRPGGPLLGAHDAVADNLAGRVISFGNGHYGIQLDIRYAAAVQNQSGDYLWAVALVQISPGYQNSGIVAQPARLYFDASGGHNNHGGNNSGNQTKGS